MTRFLLAALVGMMAFSSATLAAESKPPKELVEDLSKKAYDGFLAVKNAQGEKIVKPEDAKTLKYPLTPYDEREMAVARGYLSATAKWCGLKWDKDYFVPYINALKKEHGKKWTPFQYAYTEVLHGLSMAVADDTMEGKKCSPEEKSRIAALAKK